MNADNRIPASSPWGEVQYGNVLADGIIVVGTASHGGVRISAERLRQMPPALRLGRRRWFEEDCEAALVAVAFADELGHDDARRENAARSVADYFPAKWEAHFGRTLQPGESYARDRELFEAATADRMVVGSAVGAGSEGVPEGMVGVTARRRSDGARGLFLVDRDRYRSAAGRFGYVIDESVDQVWTEAPERLRAA
ncbi:DUF7007 domain-containing protein [Prescottella agglutinans]|uniref:DUF7007 domain-containing protein n=1 Tax=Prescottella agglutinans TaxID=1644129 RepID=A0ABT6MJS8_9NOCA|nr:hypothetical protein [Prescottella agglutinans]MDH6284061.1 hypothetical protein [Prescottella agglutinans]